MRLIRTLRRESPGAPIVVHHDFTQSILDPATLKGVEGLHLLRSTGATRWGDWSLAATMLLLFEWVDRNLDYDWLVLLSGRDYPLKPLAKAEGELISAPCDAFVEVACEVEDHEHSPGAATTGSTTGSPAGSRVYFRTAHRGSGDTRFAMDERSLRQGHLPPLPRWDPETRREGGPRPLSLRAAVLQGIGLVRPVTGRGSFAPGLLGSRTGVDGMDEAYSHPR